MTGPVDRERVAAWITRMKGDRTGQEFAADVTGATGWSVDRSRLSKYANGSIHIGRDVIAHLSDYAQARGYPPLDLTPAEPAPDLATALLALTRELAAAREERATLRAELDDLHELVGQLYQERPSGPAPGGSRAPGARPQSAGSGR